MRHGRWTRKAILVAGLVAVGCGKQPEIPVAERAAPGPLSTAGPATPSAPAAEPATITAAGSFADAISEASPDDQLPPADVTRAGKSTGKLRQEVAKQWATVAFADAAGKPLDVRVKLDTVAGPVVLKMRPDLAPNHARHFVALAKAGYFDGLGFDGAVQQQGEEAGSAIELIQGGCPLGTGEVGIGHLGYWLRPEFSEAAKHAAGMVGTSRDDSPDSDGVRFYIALSAAPVMDGQFALFAEVVEGLDAIRTMATQLRGKTPGSTNDAGLIRSATVSVAPAK